MGRHSAGRQGPFYRSLLGWALPWLLIAAFVGVAVWFLVGSLGGDDASSPTADETPSPVDSPTPEASETLVLASPTPSPTPKPTRTKDAARKPLITEGINVQVLNSTSDSTVDDAIAERLTDLGFRIENLERASRAYERTTVFWSYPEAREAAERLAARFDWVAEPKPENLSETVALHVVVGTDEL